MIFLQLICALSNVMFEASSFGSPLAIAGNIVVNHCYAIGVENSIVVLDILFLEYSFGCITPPSPPRLHAFGGTRFQT